MKILLLSWSSLVGAVLACTLSLRVDSADLIADYVWNPMKIGGGGWVTGLDISPTEKDLVNVRTDVSGAYRWNSATSSWKQLVTTASMPPGVLSLERHGGVDSLVGAPSAPDIAYMAFSAQPYGEAEGEIYRSTDRGDTWTATRLLPHRVRMAPNGEGRHQGGRLAVDPADSGVVYYGSISQGIWSTHDAGGTWRRVDEIPSGAPHGGVSTVIFDRASGTTRGKTNTIYVTVEQAGVYRTVDAGLTWIRISDSGPGNGARPRDAAIGPDRTYYVACDSEGGSTSAIWRYAPDRGWTDITPPGPAGGDRRWWAIDANPKQAAQLVAMIHGGRCFVSNDKGGTWTAHGFRLKGDGVQWQERQTNYFLSVGGLAFDPFTPGRLWFAEGFGVWQARLPAKAPDIEWRSVSQGIEETCGKDLIAPPGGKPVAAMWDLGALYFDNPGTYTARKSPSDFMSAWALDWCASDPRFLVGVFRSHIEVGPHPRSDGYSTDGGRTWTRFAALEKGAYPADLEHGVVAVSADSPDNIVRAPARDAPPFYTTDRGATWTRCSLGGAAISGLHNHPTSMKPLCADAAAATRGFLGDYEIVVVAPDGRTATGSLSLAQDTSRLTIRLDPE